MIDEKPFQEATHIVISRNVNYADLGLSKDWGRELLSIRITEVAHDVCREVWRRYPAGAWKGSPSPGR
jgi:UrcA family protein